MTSSSPPADLDELKRCLAQPLPEIPSKYLYDDRGSELFARITELEAYYPTRTETGILRANAWAMIEALRPRHLAELGSGVGTKIKTLLDAMEGQGLMESCAFFEINEAFLEHSAAELSRLYPDLEVRAIQGDFLRDLDRLGPGGERLILFLAGTIGNLKQEDVPAFLGRVAAQMTPGDGFLVGLDLVKDLQVLETAYNDPEGVTAAFNRNILSVVNQRFGTDFDLEAFAHRAFFDPEASWIEMRLVAQRETSVRLGEVERTFKRGDEIRTEVSCKYTRARFETLLADTPLRIHSWYTDANAWFANVLLEREA